MRRADIEAAVDHVEVRVARLVENCCDDDVSEMAKELFGVLKEHLDLLLAFSDIALARLVANSHPLYVSFRAAERQASGFVDSFL